MSQIESLTQTLNIEQSSKSVIHGVLSSLESGVLEAWVAQVKISEGRVVGTYYSDLAAKLTFNDFVALYTALGYDMSLMDTWKDWRCSDKGCVSDTGFSCDTDSCK